MAEKKIENYARELIRRGYTQDAARTLMLSRGFPDNEIKKAISKATKPERGMNIQILLGTALILILILIPTLLLLTKDKITTDRETRETYPPTQQTNKQQQTPEQTQQYECFIDEECSINEFCLNNKCTLLSCEDCETATNHQCQPLNCDDNNQCTTDSCANNTCTNTLLPDCTSSPQQLAQTNQTGTCQTDLDCFDGNTTTIDKCQQPTPTAPKECIHIIPTCQNDDGICPQGCSNTQDNDCNAICGNNITESTEQCDGQNCPIAIQDCDDNNTCTSDSLLGSASQCTAQCANTPITTNITGDSCCLPGNTYSQDQDCPPASTLIKQGTFTTVIYTTSGNIEIYSYENGDQKLIFEPAFFTTGPGPHSGLDVYLATNGIILNYQNLQQGNYNLEPLQTAGGSQQYDIPTAIDINLFNSIVIYSSQYNAVYAYATI